MGKWRRTLNAELVPSGKLPQNPTEAITVLSLYEGITFYLVPTIIYSTTAEENELDGTYMFTNGTVIEFGAIENLTYVLIDSGVGVISLVNDGENVMSQGDDWDLLEVGEDFGFFFLYLGFANVTQTASGMFINIDREGFEPPIVNLNDGLRLTAEEVITLANEITEFDFLRSYFYENNVRIDEYTNRTKNVSIFIRNMSGSDFVSTVIIFENSSNGEAFDHTVTSAEASALYYVYILREGNVQLRNLLSRFSN